MPVQYFERRRMEIHPKLPGSPILLGLLGNEVLAQPTAVSRYPDCLNEALPGLRDVNIGKPLGCPMFSALPGVPASTQEFERGIMVCQRPRQCAEALQTRRSRHLCTDHTWP